MPKVISQTEEIVGKRSEVAICDRDLKVKAKWAQQRLLFQRVLKTELHDIKKQRCVRDLGEAAREPVIGHLKSDFCLARNFLKGTMGDTISLT